MSVNALVANNLPIPSSLGSLAAYIGAVNRIPVLTAEQEQSLARRFRDEDYLDAAQQLVLSHLRLVVHVARRCQVHGSGMGGPTGRSACRARVCRAVSNAVSPVTSKKK